MIDFPDCIAAGVLGFVNDRQWYITARRTIPKSEKRTTLDTDDDKGSYLPNVMSLNSRGDCRN